MTLALPFLLYARDVQVLDTPNHAGLTCKDLPLP
jgi:hypothetical protein